MQLPIQVFSKSIAHEGKDHDEANATADAPEVGLVLLGVHYTLQVHAKVGGEEGEGQEDDGDAGEEEDGLVLAVGDNGHFVLFNGAQLEKFGEGGLEVVDEELAFGVLLPDHVDGPLDALVHRLDLVVVLVGQHALGRVLGFEAFGVNNHALEQFEFLLGEILDGTKLFETVEVLSDESWRFATFPGAFLTLFLEEEGLDYLD